MSLNFTQSFLYREEVEPPTLSLHWVYTAPIKLEKCDDEKGKRLPSTTWSWCFKGKYENLVPVWDTKADEDLFFWR